MIGKIPALLVGTMVVLGLYVLPSVTAKFSGSHTMEYDANIAVFQCQDCHTYILDELTANSLSTDVYSAHANASVDTNYVGSGKEIDITTPSSSSDARACIMCHVMESDAVNLAGTHTKITIRACTDNDCHGNGTTTGASAYPTAGQVGGLLSNSSDAHSVFFKSLEGSDSGYSTEDSSSGNYSAGFFACMSCHTHIEMNMELNRPQAYDVQINFSSSGTTITGPTINYTVLNKTVAQRAKGSVWQ